MSNRHKWFNEIVAWANGAEIECRVLNRSTGTWNDWRIIDRPNWIMNDRLQYRIKPTHPNQDVVDQWKQGAKVQARYIGHEPWIDLLPYREATFKEANHGMEYRIKPHPHQDLIDAYAKGAKIQTLVHLYTQGKEEWQDTDNPLFLIGYQYRIKPDPYTELKQAFQNGAKIQFYSNTREQWEDTEEPDWKESTKYRIKIDPHAELKLAFRNGATIQARVKWSKIQDDWFDHPSPEWDEKHCEYRIKPHKHQLCIDAYNRGETIQFRPNSTEEWLEFNIKESPKPGWFEYYEYRIKPKDTKSYGYIYWEGDSKMSHFKHNPNVEMIFDSDTYELKEVKLI